MAIHEDVVVIPRRLFDCMRQHCENCEYCCSFNLQGNIFNVVNRDESTHNLKKRKASQLSGLQRPSPTSSLAPRPSHLQQSSAVPRVPQQTVALSSNQQEELLTQSGAEPSRTELSTQSPNSNGRSPASSSRGKRSPQREAVNRFIKNAPRGAKWRQKQIQLGLGTAEEYENVTKKFIHRENVGSKSSYGLSGTDNDLFTVGVGLATLTNTSLANINLQRSFAYFQVLVLFSYCEYLRRKGVAYEEIDKILQIVTDIRERDRKSLLDTASWINRLVVELVLKGWTLQRATELFFINAMNCTDLVRIRSEETFQTILGDLSSDLFVGNDYNDCLTPSYTIPGLIAALLAFTGGTINQIQLAEIYDVLGYNLPNLQTSIDTIYRVYPAVNILINPAPFEVLTSQSYESHSTSQPLYGLSEQQRLDIIEIENESRAQSGHDICLIPSNVECDSQFTRAAWNNISEQTADIDTSASTSLLMSDYLMTVDAASLDDLGFNLFSS